ncbi:MAG: hypothetical protein DMF62_08255 [Acidobacteria bacterium]|nr:MAG: hypothetical protein DMF62_08255 [Acidobacteriota bacterium]
MSIDTAIVNEIENSESESIIAVVSGVSADGEDWKEDAEVLNYASNGFGFYLDRECGVGNLVSITMQMPPHLRCYDHDEEFYRVWGIIQNCSAISGDGSHLYQIAAAFIGREPPDSYGEDPLQNYRICGVTGEGLWKVTESNSKFVQRQELRYWHKVELYLVLVGEKRGTLGGERILTENVSKTGAALITNLQLNVTDRIKLISEEFDFSSHATVCNVESLDDGKMRAHLKFIDGQFPVEKLRTERRKRRR